MIGSIVAPAMDCVIITPDQIAKWRKEARYPTGRIGLFFSAETALHFCEPLSPLDFDFYVLPNFASGVALFERSITAYRAFREICPNQEIIF